MIEFLRRLFSVPEAPAIHVPVTPETVIRIPPPPTQNASKAGMRIMPSAAVMPPEGGGQAPVHPFVIPVPPPGVVPEGYKGMAQDSDIQSVFNYATSGGFTEGLSFPGYAYLAELAQRPEYRKIAETLAKEMTRRWIKITAQSDDSKQDRVTELSQAMDKFGVRDIMRKVAELDGFFGRAHVYVDTGESEDSDELSLPLVLDKAKLKKGGLKGFKTIEPFWSYPAAYNATDPLHASFYKPSSWFVQGRPIHSSRFLTFVSREVPDMLKPAYMFGGLSMSQIAKPYIDNWLRTRQSVSDLLASFSTMVLSTNLSGVLNGGDGNDIRGRIRMFNLYRSNRGSFVVDKETETLTNVSAPLGTVDHLQAQAQEQMGSVSNIPLVKLLGIAPSGLNASSAEELLAFQDFITAFREHLCSANLQTMFCLIQLHLWGEIDLDLKWAFEPLGEMSEQDKVSMRQTNGAVAASYIENGVITAEEERQRLAHEEGGSYNGLDLSVHPEPPGSEPDDEESDDEEDKEDGPGQDKSPFALDNEWEEGKHKRDASGKFGGGSSSSKKAGLSGSAVSKGEGKDAVRTQADGKPLPPHIQSLKLPPAWTDVKFSHDPDAALLAQGKDGKGRVQSVYSAKFAATQAAAKFERVQALAKQFSHISAQNAVDRASTDPKHKDAADCLHLIMKMGIRPGSDDDTGADKKAYGATTLQGKHVVHYRDGAYLEFTGKKGVALKLPIPEEDGLAHSLTDRAKKAGADGPLFPNTNDKQLLDYTHTLGDGSFKGGFKTKDFRTHLATSTAAGMVSSMPDPETPADYKKAVRQVAEKVSKVLGNTPTVALQSYINPTIFAKWSKVK